MFGIETAEPWHQPAGGESGRDRDHERVRRAVVGQSDRLRQFMESGVKTRGDERAELRRREPVAGALEQGAADLLFGAPDLLAHCAGRNAEFLGGL